MGWGKRTKNLGKRVKMEGAEEAEGAEDEEELQQSRRGATRTQRRQGEAAS